MLAPGFIDVIAPGFSGSKRELTTTLVRILFPGAGLLVISAWCLGVLNSHRKFFISYTAPVIWNAAMITTLVLFGGGGRTLDRLAVILAIGSVAGSGLQFAVQLPSVLGVFGHAARGGRPSPSRQRSDRSFAISAPRSSAAASSRSARISTPCWPACCRPVP